MYSIFSTKTKRRNYLEEGEPPPKKTVTEEDILVKKLAANQLKTTITLAEQLDMKKEFTSSESFRNVTSFISGWTDLKDFQKTIANVDELNNLKRKGLSDKDIEMYRDYVNMGSEFWTKYKGISEDVLYRHINEIKEIVNNMDSCNHRDSIPSILENQEKSLNPLELSQTEQLKFATRNEPQKDSLPGPMDELPGLEKQFMDDLEEYSSCDIKKIRKKARSMGNKIKILEVAKNMFNTNDCMTRIEKNKISERPTLWDVKEKPSNLEKKVEIIDKDKKYTCKPQNWYTLKDGKIIKLDQNKEVSNDLINTQNHTGKSKLTLEEIKNIPKFKNYESGKPSKTLYLKNLGKNVTDSCFKNILTGFDEGCYNVKCMNGKMKGQAFIEFQDIPQASKALEILNGFLLEGKPIIVQFGNKRNT